MSDVWSHINSSEPTTSREELLFEWLKVACVQPLPAGIVDLEVGVDRGLNFLRDELLARLKAYVLACPLAEHDVQRTKTIEWPATPWQHWKHRHADAWWLRWLVRRRPVRMQVQVVDFREAWQELAAYPWQTSIPRVPSELGAPSRVVRVLTAKWNVEDQP